MLFFLTSRVISSIVAFLYPGYCSYKTLSQRPASEEELERWLMYWCVLGCVVGIEYVAEWMISWIPFYYTLKTLFLLYIALPQTQGSSYLYTAHLQPFFRTHESQIDTTLASFKSRIYAFVQQRTRLVWNQLAIAMGQPISYASGSIEHRLEEEDQVGSAHPPTLSNPMSGPMQLFSNLWTAVGPSVVAGGMTLLRQTATDNRSSANRSDRRPSALNTPPSSYIRRASEQNSGERRRQELEEEPHDSEPITMEKFSGSTATGKDNQRERLRLRTRTTSGGSTGRFEEVEVVSDEQEGYDVDDEDVGVAYPPASGEAAAGGWFGWGSSASTKRGYERVKSD